MKILKGDINKSILNIKYIDIDSLKTNSNNHKVITFDENLSYTDTVYVAPYCDECDGEYLWINYLYQMNKIGIKVVSIMGRNFLPIASLFSNEMIIVEQNILDTFKSSHTKNEEVVSIYNPKYMRRTRPRKYPKEKPINLSKWYVERPFYFDIKSRNYFDEIKSLYKNKTFLLYKTPRYKPVIEKIWELAESKNIFIDHNWKTTYEIAQKMSGDILTYQILSSLETNNKFIGFAGVSNLFCVAPVNSLFLCDYTTYKYGPILKKETNRIIFNYETDFIHHSVNRNQGERRFHPDLNEIESIKIILSNIT